MRQSEQGKAAAAMLTQPRLLGGFWVRVDLSLGVSRGQESKGDAVKKPLSR